MGRWLMAEIEDQRDDLVKRLMGRRYDVDRLRAYYEGDHPLPWAPKEVRDAYLALMRMARSNWCRLIVQAPAERLRVLGLRFSTEPGPGQLSDTEVWRRIWQGNRMDLQSRQLHTTALWGRRSFALVWPRAGRRAPAITAEHPAQVLVDYAPGDRARRTAAVKVFVDQSSGRQYCTVWTPEGVWNWYRPWSNAAPAGGQLSMTGSNQLVSPSGTSLQGKWLPWADPAQNIEPEAANPTGEVPVFEFVAHPEMMGEPLGELDGGVTDVQDRINRTVLDRLVTSNFASFPQRYATGLEVPKDDQGNDVEPFKTSVTRLWQAEDPMVKFGQFPVADLANYLNSVEADIQHLAATTRTPPHYLLGQSGAFPSGDSLKATETGLVAKTLEIRDAFSEVHEDMLRFALRLDEDPRADDQAMSLVWQNPESRSDAEMMDAATKLAAIGFPFRDVAAYLGRSPEEIERLENERAEDAALSLVAPPLPAPMPTLALPAASAPGAAPRSAPLPPGGGR